MQDFSTFIQNHLALFLAAIGVMILVLIVEALRGKRGTFSINATDAIQKINRHNAIVIDTRPKDIYLKNHIIGAVSLTPKEIEENSKKLEKYKNKLLILVCNTGIESQKLTTLLVKQGYNAFSLTGGMRAWTQAQMPLVKE